MGKAKQGFASTMVGVSISIINAIVQFLMIYWVLQAYGTEFNGFIRLTAALTTVGGTTEGALGIATVVLLIKPLSTDDFITANEIFSTAKSRYKKGIIINTVLIALIAVLYPLEIVLAPILIKGNGDVNFNMTLVHENRYFLTVPFYQLIIIVFFFGIKNIISAGFFGAYENVIQADQQNGVRRLIVLFTDIVVYGILFYLLNLTTSSDVPLSPIIPFAILLIYAPIRGCLIMIYVKRNYHWLKFYREFDNFQLRKISAKMFATSIAQTILFNVDIVLILLVLGGYGLRTSSMLSLYLIIGVNLRLIMTNFITSFREYFVSVLVKDGRLYWESYSKYELYIYVVSAFTFLVMSILGPYFVNSLYGNIVVQDIENLKKLQLFQNILAQAGSPANGNITELNIGALEKANDFMFQQPLFSILYGASTAFILLIQGQYTLVQAKGRVEQVSKTMNGIAITFLIFATGGCLIFSIPQSGDYFIVYTLITFYCIKLFFMCICYGYLWVLNWNRGTYNSNTKHVAINFSAFALPIIIGVLANYFVIQIIYPIEKMTNIGPLILMILIVIGISLGLTIITSLALRPKVAISLILMLPIVKTIVKKSKNESRYKRLRDENIDIDKIPKNELLFSNDVKRAEEEFNNEKVQNLDEIFKPKIYKLKNKENES